MKDAKALPPVEKKNVSVLTAYNPVKGPANAKITIQIFGDFQCPFCKRAQLTLTQIADEYKDQVRFVWRNLPLPFHQDAALAAEAAQEVFEQKGAAGFWKYHDQLFEAQGTDAGIKRATLEKLARGLGCNMAKFNQALDSHRHKAKVDADLATANQAGIAGTPAFVINGLFVSGAQPFLVFKRTIENALKQ
jgi:protein-disulfide isomerase